MLTTLQVPLINQGGGAYNNGVQLVKPDTPLMTEAERAARQADARGVLIQVGIAVVLLWVAFNYLETRGR